MYKAKAAGRDQVVAIHYEELVDERAHVVCELA